MLGAIVHCILLVNGIHTIRAGKVGQRRDKIVLLESDLASTDEKANFLRGIMSVLIPRRVSGMSSLSDLHGKVKQAVELVPSQKSGT